jgi:putative nucleotide binding protein
VLDYLPQGRSTERGYHKEPVALGLGEQELKLLEILPKLGTPLGLGDRIPLVPVGSLAPPIDHVRRRLSFSELTAEAQRELPIALEKIVTSDPARFLKFFNQAEAVSRRFHLLELLPGIGKKTMWAIVEERRRGPFESFAALEERTHVKHPEKLIVARIVQELQGAEDKYRLFVAP